MSELIQHPRIVEAVQVGLQKHNQMHPNAAARIARILLQPTPPQADAGEITEKGYINQNKSQALRAADVKLLYSGDPQSRVIVL